MGNTVSIRGRHAAPLPANREQPSAAARLGALHRKSGTLTHDLNNLLGVILSANERLAAELPEGSEQQKLALLALEAAERGAELLRRSLAITQDQAADVDTVDGQAALDALRPIARQAISPGVALDVCDLSEPLQCVGDRTDLEMALLNLCLNAGQATPDGGEIVVQAGPIRLNRSAARRLGLAPGDYGAFTVRDTGKGMSPEILARARELLFTTRATGSGLGLSAILDFAASAGGALALRSREGHGTTATLYLRLAPTEPQAIAA